jgi:hypothetical protein
MSVDLYKAEADRLFEHLSRKHGVKLKKSSILESIAVLHGHTDWNTLVAVTKDQPSPGVAVPSPAPLSSSIEPAENFTNPSPELLAKWSERREKVRLAQIEGARSRDSLEKIGIPKAVADAWLTSLLTNTSGIFFVCGPTGSGKTTAMYATACELNRRGIRFAQVEDILEYPHLEGNLYYTPDVLKTVLLFAKQLEAEGVNVVFIPEGDRYHAYAEMLASLGFRVVADSHSSRIRARLSALKWADHVIDRVLRAALNITIVNNPENHQRLPLTHLEVYDTSGTTASYGAPHELLTGIFGSLVFESELPCLPVFFADAGQTGASEFEVRLMPKKRQ